MEDLTQNNLTTLRKMAKQLKIQDYQSKEKSQLMVEIAYLSSEDDEKVYSYGVLDIINDLYGFLRSTPQNQDVYVSGSQIKKFALRKGDIIFGEVREPLNQESNYGLLKLIYINGESPEISAQRPVFDDLIPTYPTERFKLSQGSTASRIIDLIAPIGKGQRGLIVASPKVGKTTILASIANDIFKIQ